jgi:Holliday junction DNA helicase RuvA
MVQVDVNGIGYEVLISLNTYSRIQNLDKGILHTCLLIREDAHLLIGFFELAEKEMFLHLISVSGIGSNTARVMLSYLKPDELARSILTADLRTLESIKGIGKKTAERMVLELKDKLAKNLPTSNISTLKYNTLHTDALNALMALGIARNTADQAVQKVTQNEPTLTSIEDVIKRALKIL